MNLPLPVVSVSVITSPLPPSIATRPTSAMKHTHVKMHVDKYVTGFEKMAPIAQIRMFVFL